MKNNLSLYVTVLCSIGIFFAVAEIITCFFILKMKKWALFTYIGLSVVGSINKIIAFNFIPIIAKALLLYLVFKNDWEYFE